MVDPSQHRQPLPHSAPLVQSPQAADALALLIQGRLVLSQGDHYELAHEAIIQHWPRLQRWWAKGLASRALQESAEQAAPELAQPRARR